MFEEQQHLFRCSRLPHLLERVWVSVELQQSGEFEVDGKKINHCPRVAGRRL
jgi:hypothetical protein